MSQPVSAAAFAVAALLALPSAAQDFTLRFADPAPGATVRDVTRINGLAPGMHNVELFIGGNRQARSTPDARGAWSAEIDFARQPQGALTVVGHAWDSPAGDPGFHHESGAELALVNAGGRAPPAAAIDPATKPPPRWDMSGWHLVFNEEFRHGLDRFRQDGSAPHGRWQTWFYFGDRTLNKNGERQYYMDPEYGGSCQRALGVDPFRIERGVLHIVGQRTDPAVRPCIWGYEYTSGLITTEPSFSQTYGRFVARMKMPHGKGLWPAFWLLPVDKTWPPELDAIEFFGAPNSRGEGGATIYRYGAIGSGGDWVNVGVDLGADFHEYGIEWGERELVYTFDGREIARMPTSEAAHKPMYLLVNLAIGGHWPELPDGGTRFPAELLVDWVRAYSR
jgi:hypothetical protein